MSQLKISDFSGEMFKGFEVLYFSVGTAVAQWLRCCATNRKVRSQLVSVDFSLT